MSGIIIIDKPADWTSMDVCAKLRGVLHEKHVGHGGTLDPMATGVLPVFTGRATRAVEYFEAAEKRYTAAIRFGTETDTQDITGRVLREEAVSITRERLEAVLPEFTGAQKQIPPMYSAIKINGQKLYNAARKGVEIERKARDIVISSVKIIGERNGDFLLDICCSKGTYIRTLCADIGTRLGCGAVMASLRRTAAGMFTEHMAVGLDDFIRAYEKGEADPYILSAGSVFISYPRVDIPTPMEAPLKNGNPISFDGPDGLCRVYMRGVFSMLGRIEAGVLKIEKNFSEV